MFRDKNMRHLGLFAGIGGFELAAKWMGWDTIAWCEWNLFCQKVLKHHFPEAKGHGDITTTDFTIYRGQCDILTGGFPCQPYSTAGKRLGKDDNRHLWPEMLRAIREVSPRWVVGENVRGLTNWNGGLVFDEVQADLENEGYEVLPFLLPACAVSAPHRRDRIWFVAHASRERFEEREALEGGQQFIEGRKARGESESYGSLQNASDAYGRRLPQRYDKQDWRRSQPVTERSNSIGGWQDFPTQSPVRGRDDGLPAGLVGITVPKHRNESIKGYGNAIVPQAAYQIYHAIEQYDNQNLLSGDTGSEK